MVTVEQTEKVESGLDVVVRGEHGGIICWCEPDIIEIDGNKIFVHREEQ